MPDPDHEATLRIGADAPILRVTEWLAGAPVQIGEGHVLAIEFWVIRCGPCVEGFANLSELQQRFGERGLRVVGVTPRDQVNTLEQVQRLLGDKLAAIRYAIAFDGERAAHRAFMRAADERRFPVCFVVDRSDRLAWIGHPERLHEVVESVLNGTHDLDALSARYERNRRLARAWHEQDWAGVISAADAMLDVDRRDAHAWSRKLAALHNSDRDHRVPKELAAAALVALAGQPASLAAVAATLLGMRLEAVDHAAIEAALRPSVDAGATDPALLLSYMRVLDGLGRTGETPPIAERFLAAAADQTGWLATFVTRALAFADPALLVAQTAPAIDAVIAARGEQPDLLAQKFLVTHHSRDLQGAEKVGRAFIDRAIRDPRRLNDFAWRLLTDPHLEGQFEALALRAAEMMIATPDGFTHEFLDTLALAKFRNGEIAAAIEIQTKAVTLCDGRDSGVGERLARYRAAAPPTGEGSQG